MVLKDFRRRKKKKIKFNSTMEINKYNKIMNLCNFLNTLLELPKPYKYTLEMVRRRKKKKQIMQTFFRLSTSIRAGETLPRSIKTPFPLSLIATFAG